MQAETHRAHVDGVHTRGAGGRARVRVPPSRIQHLQHKRGEKVGLGAPEAVLEVGFGPPSVLLIVELGAPIVALKVGFGATGGTEGCIGG